ncbi:MAG: SBBP repeat-containing protein, partial [Bryobacteraceae bacterium]
VAKLNPSASALIYSTYLGGVYTDEANAIAVDAQGNAYVAGTTRSPNFPTTPGAYQRFYNSGFTTIEGDGFIVKLDPTGSTLVYSSYFGGNSMDRVFGVAVDGAGSAYLTGDTLSSNFPTSQGALRRRDCSDGVTRDAFIGKLSPSGASIVYSTYLCGSGADSGYGIAVDAQGAAYVVGQTVSTDFPVTAGVLQPAGGGSTEDAFVSKINPDGSALVFSTYLGGSLSDIGRGIALDAQLNVYVTGYTLSTDFPVRTGSYRTAHSDGGLYDDAFIAKLNPAGSQLVYSTYAGGAKSDRAQAIVVDSTGAAYITGSTASPDFPVQAAKCQPGYSGREDVFVMKLNAAGSALAYTMVLGGQGDDRGYAIALDSARNPILGGQTVSVNYPTTSGVLASGNARGYGGGSDGFVARVLDAVAPAEPCISLNGVVNAGSFLAGPVAPGEIVTILGAGIGPPVLVPLRLDSPDTVSRTLSDTRVLVDGVAVPLLYVRSDQVSAIVPFDAALKTSVRIEVEYKGVKTAVFQVAVADASPSVFTAGSGTGQGAILNQNGSFNAFNNPAVRGEVIVIYATGGGETDPASADGKLSTEALKLKLTARAQIGGRTAQVLYAGAAPGLVAGVM